MSDIAKIFTAEPKSLADFLSANDQGCFVPSYQRAYSWDVKDVTRLFEDTVDGLRRLVGNPESLRFLGTIIAVNEKGVVPVDPPMDGELPNVVMTIIDGQQRLCTLLAVNIMLHDAIRRRGALIGEGPEADRLKQWMDDFLFDLVKTIRFEGRPTDTVWRYYPRMIRAYEDMWARSQALAKYESPIAKLAWSYILHLESGTPSAFAYGAASHSQKPEPGHPALEAVVSYVRTALDGIASGQFQEVDLPSVSDLVAHSGKGRPFWSDRFPNEAAGLVRDSGGAATIVRLMAFGRYLNTRMAITLVTTAGEDYAFDMFEALNTTGQPLTAFETFRPKVVEAEGAAGYYGSPSKDHLRQVEQFLERFGKADDRQRATTSLLIPFALLDTGYRLEGHLSAQRRYLRDKYDSLADQPRRRAFTEALGTAATFLKSSWDSAQGTPARMLPEPLHSTDDEAGFCFEALRSLRHDVVIAPLVRFYGEAVRLGTNASIIEYEGAIKAIAAFSMLWRGARGGTSNVDAQYRSLMAGTRGVDTPLSLRKPDGSANPMASLAQLQRSLWTLLDQPKVGLGTKDVWVAAAAQQPIQESNAKVARFLLMAACNNTVADPAVPGLLIAGGRGNLALLTATKWYDDAHVTVEHVAPESGGRANWSRDIYDADDRTVNQLGNLTLLPARENDALADRDWAHKKAMLTIFAAESDVEAETAMAAAQRMGLTISNRIRSIVQDGNMLPLCRPLSRFAGPWDAEFIAKRSRRLSELAWDKATSWLGPRPA